MATIVLLLTLAVSSLAAADIGGHKLASDCAGFNKSTPRTEKESLAMLICAGYVQGVVDADSIDVTINEITYRKSATVYCLPKGNTYEQLIRVVAKYTKEHPEHWHWKGPNIIGVALMKAFPCENTIVERETKKGDKK